MYSIFGTILAVILLAFDNEFLEEMVEEIQKERDQRKNGLTKD